MFLLNESSQSRKTYFSKKSFTQSFLYNTHLFIFVPLWRLPIEACSIYNFDRRLLPKTRLNARPIEGDDC